MKQSKKRIFGFIAGIAAAIVLWVVPLEGLSPEGQHCLAMTACTIIWWALEVANAGYIACGLLLGYLLLLDPTIAAPQVVLKLWSSSMLYLIVGGFLIAGAVKRSGVAKRFALICLGRFVKTYRQAVISCYVLSYAFGLIIPQSFPRAFLIMGVMSCVSERARIDKKAAANLGLAVFAAQIGAGMFLMTSESMLNFALLEQLPSDMRPSWLMWAAGMSLPAVFLGTMMCAIQLKLFKGPDVFCFGPQEAREELEKMGPMSATEKKTIFWLAAAVVLWMTDRLHGIDLGWVSLGVAVLMSLPVIGDLTRKEDWADIDFGTLMFLTACIAIGAVGNATGMNDYLAHLILPTELETTNAFLFGCLAAVICIVMHLALGSIMATYALAIPALLSLAEPLGISGMAVGLIVYIATTTQFFFPYQSLYMTMGMGDNAGGYHSSQVMRFGLCCTVPVLLCVLFSLGWWTVIGWI